MISIGQIFSEFNFNMLSKVKTFVWKPEKINLIEKARERDIEKNYRNKTFLEKSLKIDRKLYYT